MSNLQISVNKKHNETEIKIKDSTFVAHNHWFWDQFSNEWEPQTIKFFECNLEENRDYLDIGGWVGPTAFIATALGARIVKIVEPNPMNFLHLLIAQLGNEFLSKWFLVNACVSTQIGTTVIGPIEGIKSSSSATNIRDKGQTGAPVISLRLEDIIQEGDDFSLIKIDIEGAEVFIIKDLAQLAQSRSAIWLSIHPPFMDDKHEFSNNLGAHRNDFYFVDENNQIIDEELIRARILSEEKNPEWGTPWGNFFEIGLLPKKSFNENGIRIN